ncbi:MAG TPA: sigma-70 family RNA polymerase sigma factor [Acidimicrobiales bacterium]|nr:sigma-70 family RNA polymerase sigma factor [Acidimicrobiales bacterium]
MIDQETTAEEDADAESIRRVAVPAAWLDPFDDLAAARHLRALESDKDRLNRLMWSGYRGRAWDDAVDWLCVYGVAVLQAWIRRGQLNAKLRARGLGTLPHTTHYRDPAEAASLAHETVARAITAFRDTVLIPGRWNPEKGACLRTYFIGQCLMQVRNPYRRGLPRVDARADGHEQQDPATWPAEDPAHLAAVRDEVSRALGQITDPVLRRMVMLVAADLPYRKIATILGVSEDSVRKRLYRLRQRSGAA